MDAIAVTRHPPPFLQSLLDRYELRTPPSKWLASQRWTPAGTLFMAGEGDPLFLQVKEARASVLEPYTAASVFPNTASAS